MNELVAILLDPTAAFGDRDDAAMAMSSSDEPEVVEALLSIALDASADADLADRAGESLAAIWRRNAVTPPDLVNRMHPAAKRFFDRALERDSMHAEGRINFPAIWIASEGSFAVVDRPIESCSWQAYKNGFFEGLRFFDSADSVWAVDFAVPKTNPNAVERLLNRPVDLVIRLKPAANVSVSEVAELLCTCVDRDPGDLYSQFVDRDELKRMFRSAGTTLALIGQARALGKTQATRPLRRG